MKKLEETPKVLIEDVQIANLIKEWFTECKKLSSLEEIESEFAKILKYANVTSDKTCILKQFNLMDKSFMCQFNEEKELAKIWMNNDWYNKLVIDYKKVKRTYYYDILYKLVLENYSICNEQTGNVYQRYFSPYNAYMLVSNEDYRFIVDLDIEKFHECYPTFKLNSEQELEEYLLNLSFPININEVCKKIQEILGEYQKYDKVNLKADKKNDNVYNVTDMLVLTEGELSEYIVTKHNKIIMFDQFGNYTCHNIEDVVELDNSYNIQEEIEQTRKLIKTEFNTRW